MTSLRNLLLGLWAVLAIGAAPAHADPDDMVLGPRNAKVTVVEYASLACSHCASFHKEVFPAFRKKYIDTGKVRFVYREIITAPGAVAAAGALTARCAGPKRYFDVISVYFAGLEEVYGPGKVTDLAHRAGAAGGLKPDKVNRCITDEKALKAAIARSERNSAAGNIEGTPTFVINGKTLVGEHSLAQLSAVIDPLLAR